MKSQEASFTDEAERSKFFKFTLNVTLGSTVIFPFANVSPLNSDAEINPAASSPAYSLVNESAITYFLF